MKNFVVVSVLVFSFVTLMSCVNDLSEDPALDNSITDIFISESKLTLVVGEESILTATSKVAEGDIIWESEDPEIATIEKNGNITVVGKSVGRTNVIVLNAQTKKSATCEVEVIAAVETLEEDDVVTPPSVIADTKVISEVGYTIDFAGNSTGKAIDKLTLSDKTSYKRFWLVKDGKDYVVDATGTIVENSSKVMTAMWISDTVGWAVFVEDTSAGAHDGWYITKW